MIVDIEDEPETIPNCGFIRPGEWSCQCGETPCTVLETMRAVERASDQECIELDSCPTPEQDIETVLSSTWVEADQILIWLDEHFTSIQLHRQDARVPAASWIASDESLMEFLTRIYLENH